MMWMQRSIGALLIAGSLSLGVVGPATAQVQISDGLVNVTVGDVEILNNANISIVAQVVAQICGVKISDIAILAELVDLGGATNTVCQSTLGPVTITQNQ